MSKYVLAIQGLDRYVRFLSEGTLVMMRASEWEDTLKADNAQRRATTCDAQAALAQKQSPAAVEG